MQIGDFTYGDVDVLSASDKNIRLTIGRFCSIATGVKFFLGGNHTTDTISSYPFDVRLFGKRSDSNSNGSITVGDDVWFGQRSLIMSGGVILVAVRLSLQARLSQKMFLPLRLWRGTRQGD